jgi:hypothetical protein
MWLGSIVSIVILYFVYGYLKGLKTCSCANDLYVTRLKNLEAIQLGLNVIMFCFAILSSFHLFNALDHLKDHILKIIMLGGITMLIYYSYFAYNGYEFWNTLPEKCECANKWRKYYVYFQTIVYFIIILATTVFAGLLAFRKVKIGLVDEITLNRYITETKSSPVSAKSSSRSRSRTRSRSKSRK